MKFLLLHNNDLEVVIKTRDAILTALFKSDPTAIIAPCYPMLAGLQSFPPDTRPLALCAKGLDISTKGDISLRLVLSYEGSTIDALLPLVTVISFRGDISQSIAPITPPNIGRVFAIASAEHDGGVWSLSPAKWYKLR